jgi:hypothetical protein
MRKHLRGMSDWAPLYALIIVCGGLGVLGLVAWAIIRVVF